MIRLKDIALRAGVSIMTVSKALRDEPDISVATKARNLPSAIACSARRRASRLRLP